MARTETVSVEDVGSVDEILNTANQRINTAEHGNAQLDAGPPTAESEGSDDEIDPRQWVSRLTVATMGGNPGDVKRAKSRVAVCRVIGRANGTKIVKSDKADAGFFIAVTGEFEGLNMQTGEVFASGVTYFPGGMHEAIVSELEHTPAGGSVEYALQIDADPANNPIGYSYIIRSLLPPSRVDSLARLRAKADRLLPPPAKLLTGPAQAS